MIFILGPERRSVEIDNKNKTITAYHESGHAIIAYYTKDAMPINKATIMPRGPTLGHVSFLSTFLPLPSDSGLNPRDSGLGIWLSTEPCTSLV